MGSCAQLARFSGETRRPFIIHLLPRTECELSRTDGRAVLVLLVLFCPAQHGSGTPILDLDSVSHFWHLIGFLTPPRRPDLDCRGCTVAAEKQTDVWWRVIGLRLAPRAVAGARMHYCMQHRNG